MFNSLVNRKAFVQIIFRVIASDYKCIFAGGKLNANCLQSFGKGGGKTYVEIKKI